MLDIKFIRQNIDEVKKSIADRGMNVDLGELLGLDEKRRVLIRKIDEARAERNKKSENRPSAEEIEKLRLHLRGHGCLCALPSWAKGE